MLTIRNLKKQYSSAGSTVTAVHDVSLGVPDGAFFTLLGPSGCGKTTILQCIAGLETPSGGDINIGGVTVFSSATDCNVPPHRRQLGMVFQSYAIWPHMTVFENVAFPLRRQRPRLTNEEIKKRVMTALELVKLEAVAATLAPFLSGGQQQRVALARAIVHRPRLLLLDEPLSNLDAKLREEMRLEIGRLVREVGITTIFVTHDQAEALSMSDNVALLEAGRVVQQGTPRDIYFSPQSIFAARFIGGGSIVPGVVTVAANDAGAGEIETAFGRIGCNLPHGADAGDDVDVVLRPEGLRLCNGSAPTDGRPNFLRVEVSQTTFVGDSIEAISQLGPTSLRVRLDPHTKILSNHAAIFEVLTDRCVVLRREV
jgi:iron(III) transport system ATP-binding protein